MFLFEKVQNVIITNNSFGREFDPEKDMELKLSEADAVSFTN